MNPKVHAKLAAFVGASMCTCMHMRAYTHLRRRSVEGDALDVGGNVVDKKSGLSNEAGICVYKSLVIKLQHGSPSLLSAAVWLSVIAYYYSVT